MNKLFWRRAIAVAFSFLFLCAAFVAPASAQSFNTDARIIGMGGSDQSNDAAGLSEESKSYKSIGLPLGLFQIWKDKDAFKANDQTKFNPLRVIEDLSNPLHITFGRDSEKEGDLLVRDLVNGKINRNLLVYKGFVPKSPLSSRGLFSPSFGKIIRFHKVGKAYQGVYIGVGPYLSADTTFTIDPALLNAWSGATSSIPANSSLTLADKMRGQVALAVTGGYRARFANPNGLKTKNGTNRDGVYVAVNYHYLRGYHYDDDSINVRLDTDSAGLILNTVPPTPPIVVDRTWSKSGTGRSVDIGTDVVTGPWDFNFSASGVANKIDWKDPIQEKITLSSVLTSPKFVKTTVPSTGPIASVKLPVRYFGGTTYRANKWTARGQVGRGLNGKEFHAGGEYRFGMLALRGGGRYTKKLFNPMGGVGVNFTKHFGVDAAVFSTTSNAQRDHRAALALSLRFQK